ncbi:hypothetical protein [Gracilibacillus suaedae]|uniref:hypothetical protein n=1 Tax=Gracilibacillus suaedae TaxID=2820273 RepID=UPI001E35F55F|nr:hypothetical protein [Gracilibacillus suaedae]
MRYLQHLFLKQRRTGFITSRKEVTNRAEKKNAEDNSLSWLHLVAFLALGLQMFSDPSSLSAWVPMFAMSVASIVPQLLVFLFIQKYLVEGITAGSVKG